MEPLDLSPVLPPTPRETKQMNLRISESHRRVEQEEEVEPPRKRASRERVSAPVRLPPEPPEPARPSRAPSAGRALLLMVAVGIGVVFALNYFGVIQLGGLADQVRSIASQFKKTDSAASGQTATPARSSRRPAPKRTPASPASPPATPSGSPPPPATQPVATTPGPSRQVPPVRIDVLPVDNFSEQGDRFRVTQHSTSGQTLTLLGRPVVDSVGEPAEGEVRLDSVHGDTTTALTQFSGYVVSVRGVIRPAELQALLLQLVARAK